MNDSKAAKIFISQLSTGSWPYIDRVEGGNQGFFMDFGEGCDFYGKNWRGGVIIFSYYKKKQGIDIETLIENPHQVETGHGQSGEPQPWAVIIHDDDTTPVHEVISILRLHFNYTTERAIELVVDAQEDGEAEVQIYKARDMAETKAGQAMDTARGQFLELRFSAKPV